MKNSIVIKGAKENNLKNINLEIPKNKLVIFTGVSGSGKTSLAFDTIYAEGKRRYLESVSTYIRQFLGNNKKPRVDSIEGLSPAIAISQRSTSHNPRSTIGTVTEIYDYLRVLFARIGEPYCPNGHGKIETLTIKQIVNKICESFKENDKLQILSIINSHKKGTFKEEIKKLKLLGFLRIRIDKKIFYQLDDDFTLEENKFHSLDLVVDRIIGHHDEETESRIYSAVETALKNSNGQIIAIINDTEYTYSESHACKKCGFMIPELEPKLFSFNSPIGACEKCKGLGVTFEPSEEKMVPAPELTINQGAIDFFKNTVNTLSIDWQQMDCLLNHYHINKNIPFNKIKKEDIKRIFYGSDEPIHFNITSSTGRKQEIYDYYEGILNKVKRLYFETSSEFARTYYGKYMEEKTCSKCKGKRLNESALCVKINDNSIIDITNLSLDKAWEFFINLKLNPYQKQIASLLVNEITSRLTFLIDVGLEYLTLSRNASTLSGGELQRIRLATQIGSSLTGVLYVLDEPSIGLHQKDNALLIKTLKKMRDKGNSIIVVEHDEETMLSSDYIVDIGPGAGKNGGNIVFAGTPDEICLDKNSLTGKYLSHKLSIQTPKSRRSGNGQKIIIKGCCQNNLKNISVTFPLGSFICVTGVSGSGKSTLVIDTLAANIQKSLFNPFIKAGKIKSISGIQNIKKVIVVTQDPIGRTPRSNPATYIGVFDDIRELFSNVPEAKMRGYTKGRFSFNSPGGRCEKCLGNGVIRINMQFMPDVFVTCDECNGKKYNSETLLIKYKGKSIYDVLEMSIDEASDFFKNIPNIHRKISLLQDVGLGYLKLGTNSNDLSGGEAQRIKLAKFIQKNNTENTILILDEPTTGLHIDDIKKIILILNRIVDNGSTVIVIEHNLDLIKCADYIIDIGKDGGQNGGEIIATGTPEQIIKYSNISYTAKFLKKILRKD